MATTSHNISNANTEGYSRQRVEQRSNPPVGYGNYVLGTGVTVRSVKRIHDQLIESRLNTNITQHKYHDERSFQLGLVENIYNEIDSEGLANVLNRFFNSFRELANNPEDETVRSVVRENAKVVISDIKGIRANLNNVSSDIDRKLKSSVNDVNNILYNISKLNVKIAELETLNGETGDLRDQRDLAVRTLSEFFDVHTYHDDRNNYVISAKGVGTLLTGSQVQELTTVQRSPEGDVEAFEPKLDISFKSKPDLQLGKQFKGGILQAIVETRDTNVSRLQEHIDTMAFDLANMVNAIHRKGFANKEMPTDANGNPMPHMAREQVTGIDFFKTPTSKHRAAEYLELSAPVKDDLRNIVTAYTPNAPGDNRIALAISKLQHTKFLAEGTTTLEEFYLQGIGDIAVNAGKAKIDASHSEGVLAQTKAVKERISGVNLDEETANMVRFQHAYDASARVMKTSNEVFKSVLGLIG